jgi:thiamine biosynthesis protein ThiI
MKKLYLIRYGEIGIKGKNRNKFEAKLIDNIRHCLRQVSKEAKPHVYKTYGRIFVETSLNEQTVVNNLQKVFGIAGICPALKMDLDIDQVKDAALKEVQEALDGKQQPVKFSVDTKRPNKQFELDSMEINNQLGSYLLENLPDGSLEVNLDNPELVVNIEIRSKHIYVYTRDVEGVRGLPVGTTGRASLLLSGGIDSPVAGWMTMKRGVEITPIYFHSFPFTSDRAKEKVIDLAEVLADYQPEMELKVVNFTELQKQINEHCPDKFMTLVMRRLMVKIAERITIQSGGKALVTGESLGQVASQTMDALHVTNEAADRPIFRPLIGFDKIDIERRAREIGSYEISIQPYEDCCSVFVPDYPETYPRLEEVKQAEAKLDVEELVDKAVEEVEVIEIK